MLDKKLEIAVKNKGTFMLCLSVMIAVGILMMAYGFWKWHTEIQPIQDEIARLSLKKLKQEVEGNESA